MEFGEVVASRKMTRHFLPDPVDASVLQKLLITALRSPSAGFSQGVDLLVLTEQNPRQRFWELIGDAAWRDNIHQSGGLMAAPVIVVPLGNPAAYEERYRAADKAGSSLANLDAASWPVPYWTVDAAFAAMAMLLAVTDVGLGALFFQLQGHENDLHPALESPNTLFLLAPSRSVMRARDQRIRKTRMLQTQNPETARRESSEESGPYIASTGSFD